LAHRHDHADRYREGDRAAWDRELDDDVLFFPDRRDVYNFIDLTKLEFIAPRLPATGRALEVGAGSGRLLVRCGLLGALQLFALDYSPAAVRAVTTNYARAGLWGSAVLGSAESLPYSTSSFDLVISGGLLEHFRDPTRVVEEMVRVLKPGGVFYADIVPRKFSIFRLREWFRMRSSVYLSEGIFESDLSLSYWRGLLERAGLTDVRAIGAGIYPPHTMRWRPELEWRLRRVYARLDGTRVAEWLGWLYLCSGKKTGE